MSIVSFDIVVARYNENLNWLDPIASHCIIYNKGDSLDPSTAQKYKQVVALPNVGREAHTFLTHLKLHAHNVPSHERHVTVFTQGCIQDHLSKSEHPQAETPHLYLLDLAKSAANNGMSLNAHKHNKGNMSAIPSFKMSSHFPHITDTGMTYDTWLEQNIQKTIVGKTMRFPYGMKWYIAAVFAIRADVAQRVPLSVFEHLIEQTSVSADPESAYYMERTWFYMFNDVQMHAEMHAMEPIPRTHRPL